MMKVSIDNTRFLIKNELSTPLGAAIFVADMPLYLLRFADMPKLERQLHFLSGRLNVHIVEGPNDLTRIDVGQ